MKSIKEPVIYILEGTSFEVDIVDQQLRQTNDQSNIISFVFDMQDKGTHYNLLYDLAKHCASTASSEAADIKVIEVPRLTELDPEGMASQYGKRIETIRHCPDFEAIVDQESLAQRLQGVLPVIDIFGERYKIDIDAFELRHEDHQELILNLHFFEVMDDTKYLEAFFNPICKEVVKLDPDMTEFPDHIVRIQLPSEMELDPVGYARFYGKDEQKILRFNPVTAEVKAKVIALSDTYVPAMIQRNRDKLRQEHKAILEKAKPRRRLHL